MLTCRAVPDTAPGAVALIRDYWAEVIDRHHGRSTPSTMVDTLAEDPIDLAIVLIAYCDDQPVGCAGLRDLGSGIGEIKRMYVRPADRRRGIGRLLLDAAQHEARSRTWTALRLDARSDLVEARALYDRHGFREIPDYNDNPYAQHWFEKVLS